MLMWLQQGISSWVHVSQHNGISLLRIIFGGLKFHDIDYFTGKDMVKVLFPQIFSMNKISCYFYLILLKFLPRLSIRITILLRKSRNILMNSRFLFPEYFHGLSISSWTNAIQLPVILFLYFCSLNLHFPFRLSVTLTDKCIHGFRLKIVSPFTFLRCVCLCRSNLNLALYPRREFYKLSRIQSTWISTILSTFFFFSVFV